MNVSVLFLSALLLTFSTVVAQRQPWPIKVDHIGSCCNLIPQSSTSNSNLSFSGQLLQECLTEQSRSLIELNKNSEISILSLAAVGSGDHAIDNIDLYSPFHEANVGAYAEFKRYHYRIFSQLPSEVAVHKEIDFRWNKIPLLILALDTWAKSSKYIVWIDSDAIITDFNFDVKDFAEAHEGAEILASADIRLGLINTGFFIVRNSQWSRDFLQKWWTIADRNQICDQDAFDMVYKSLLSLNKNSDNLRQKIRILPMNVLNSHPPAWKHHSEQDRVLHLMGESSLYRAMVFTDAWRSICKARSGGVLPPQLGITRHRMLQQAQRVYRDLTQRTFSQANATGTMHDIEELSKASHHYVDILQYIASQKQEKEKERLTASFGTSMDGGFSSENYLEEILHIRHGVFNLIVEHLKAYRNELKVMTRETIETEEFTRRRKMILQEVVGLLKKAAEAGNALFWVSRGLENRKLIGQQVLDILDDLSLRVMDAHKPLPLHMKALMFQNLGMTMYEEAMHRALQDQTTESEHTLFVKKSLFMDAEVYFHQSIRLFDLYWELTSQLSTQSPSDHSSPFVDTAVHREYVQSLQLHAAVLCLLRRFQEGLSEWEKAVAAATNMVQGLQIGPDYEKLALVYYNAAVCHAEYGASLSNYHFAASASKGNSQEAKEDVLNAGLSLVDRSSRVLQDIISQQKRLQNHHEMDPTASKQTLLGYDEITDLEAFSSQVQLLKRRIQEKLSSKADVASGHFSTPNEELGPVIHKNEEVKKASVNQHLPHDRNPDRSVEEGQGTMKRVVLPDGSVKYSLQQPREDKINATESTKITSVEIVDQDEDDEWEECSEVDDADCLAFDVEEVTVPVSPAMESQHISNNATAFHQTEEKEETRQEEESSSLPVEMISTVQHDEKKDESDSNDEYYEDSYDEYYVDEYDYDDDYYADAYYYYDDDYYYEEDYADIDDSEMSLYEGLDPKEVEDLKAARERHRRRMQPIKFS